MADMNMKIHPQNFKPTQGEKVRIIHALNSWDAQVVDVKEKSVKVVRDDGKVMIFVNDKLGGNFWFHEDDGKVCVSSPIMIPYGLEKG